MTDVVPAPSNGECGRVMLVRSPAPVKRPPTGAGQGAVPKGTVADPHIYTELPPTEPHEKGGQWGGGLCRLDDPQIRFQRLICQYLNYWPA